MNFKYYIIILLVVNLSSCKEKVEKFYYPSSSKIENYIDTIKLNDYKSYEKLVTKLENLRGDIHSFIELKNGNHIYNIGLTTRHGSCLPKLVKMKNLITISEDSVMKNEKVFPIEYLSEILERDLKNNNNQNEYATNSKDLIVSLALRDYENVENLDKYLINLIEKFNKINKDKDYELNIQINREFFYHKKLFENLPK